MRTKPVLGIFFLLFAFFSATTCSAQPATFERIYPGDSNSPGFLYIAYVGDRYNKAYHEQDFVISVVKLPIKFIKKMPHLDGNGAYSSRNCRISARQQKFLRQFCSEEIILRANKNNFNKHYPQGLRRGMIVESEEYQNWDFLEMPRSPVPPGKKNWGTEPDKYEFNLDPLYLLEEFITVGIC